MDSRPSDGQETGATVRPGRGTLFSQVPEWIIFHPDLSDRALRLYTILHYYAWRNGSTVRTKSSMAEALGCSEPSVRRALGELVEIGAVEVEEREGPNGSRLANGYVVHFDPPVTGDADPPVTGDGSYARAVPCSGDVHLENPPVGPPVVDSEIERIEYPEVEALRRDPRLPKMVDRAPVVLEEAVLALAVLDEWNRQAGQALRAKEHVAKIVMRIREYPEATLADHARIIAANLAKPWWRGSPSPAVIYGNGSVFEQSIQTVIDEGKPEKPRVDPTATRYGRGLTTRQILDDAGVTLTMSEILDGGLTRDA